LPGGKPTLDKQTVLLILLIAALSMAVVGGVFGVSAYMREPYVVSQELLYRYSKVSRYDIYFYMKPNNIYETPIVVAESGLPIYLSLVNGVNVSYSYRVDGVRSSGSIRMAVFLRHPDGWSRKYLEKTLNFTGSATSSLYINISDAVSTMDVLCKQVGLRLTAFSITIATYIEGTVHIGSISRRDPYNHSIAIAIDLGRNRIALEGTPSITVPVEEKRNVYIKQSILGMDIETLRILSTSMASAGVIATAILAIARAKLSTRDPLKDFESRYQQIIVTASRIPMEGGSKTVYIRNPNELIKVARLLEKPIIKYVDGSNSQPIYMVIDRDTTYILEVGS